MKILYIYVYITNVQMGLIWLLGGGGGGGGV